MTKTQNNLFRKKTTWLCLLFGMLVIIISGSIKIVRAEWLEPAQRPAVETFSEPLTVSAENQVKAGKLELNPEYNPTSETSLIFDPQKPLDVKGTGARISTSYLYSDVLSVNRSANYLATFYANKDKDFVGLGVTTTQTPTDGYRLRVEGGTVQVSTIGTGVTGHPVSGYSNGSTAVYGDAGTLGGSGVYGLRTINNTGLAVKGISATSYGVYGKSVGGEGIKAVTSSMNAGAVYGQNTAATGLGIGWAGYFAGNLGAGSDIVSNRFLATNLRTSIMPFTSGQVMSTIQPVNFDVAYVRSAFDGSNLWVTTQGTGPGPNFYNIYKYRVADGQLLLALSTQAYPSDMQQGIVSVAFDGTDLWTGSRELLPAGGRVARRSAITGQIIGNPINISGDNDSSVNSLAVSVENGQKYIWAILDNTGQADRIIKINASTSAIELNIGTGVVSPRAIVYDGQNIWVQRDGALISKITPTTTAPFYSQIDYGITGTAHYPGSMVFDGEYIWSVSWDNQQVIDRLWAQNPDDPQHPRLVIRLSCPAGDTTCINNHYLLESDTLLPLATRQNAHAKGIAFDGTYIWVTITKTNNFPEFPALVRIPAYINSLAEARNTYKSFRITSGNPTYLTFDGTDMWTSPYGGANAALDKVFTGTGMGQTDLNTVVNLIDPSSVPAAQPGNFNIFGSATVAQGLTVTAGDVVVNTNLWGGSEQTVTFDGTNPASCAAGTFMKGVTINSSNNISQIFCRGL